MTESMSIIDELRESIDEEYGDGGELENPPYDRVEEEVKQVQEEPAEEEEVAAEEPEEETEPEEKPKKDLPKNVPYSRFSEVARERREAREQAERQRTEIAELRGQLTEVLRGRNQKPPPDPNEDPDAYISHINAEYNRLRGEHEKVLTEKRESETENQRLADINSYVSESIQEFSTEHPDFLFAQNHLQAAVINERLRKGESFKGAQAYWTNIVASELQRLYETEGNPAQYIYALAQDYGYQPGGTEEAPKPKRKPAPSKEAVKKANRTVTQSGRSAETDLDAIDIENMTKAQFDKYVERLKREQGAQRGLFD